MEPYRPYVDKLVAEMLEDGADDKLTATNKVKLLNIPVIEVLINGKRAPILGRVCMDQFMVDITDIEGVNYESEVTLLGRDGDEFISVEELSELAGTFNYEFVCDIGKRVPRVFLRNGKNVGMQDFSKSYLATYSLEDDI
jgi:hypothetical protein